jgi:plasmid replication initiation protein
MKQLAEKIGADKLEFKTAQIYNFENGSEFFPKNDKYSRYNKMPDGKYQIKISLFVKIAKMIVDVKNNYTFINTKELMRLKSKHSLRLLPLLNTLAGYDENIGKRKRMTLEELNEFFGTKYRSLYDIQKKILESVKKELDNNSKLSFVYDLNFESLGKGRPRAKDIVIDLIENSKIQVKLF